MRKTTNGASETAIAALFNLITTLIAKNNYIVKFRATDWDNTFDGIHLKFFGETIKNLLDADFIELLSNIAPLTSIPISELLHLHSGVVYSNIHCLYLHVALKT